MNTIYLSIGSNIGDREYALSDAILKINERIGEVLKKSKIYETEAWGVEFQQAYLNQCLEVKTSLMPLELIEFLLKIEKELGRERRASLNYEPRIIDIDVLFYNDWMIEEEQLIIPHPRLHLRNFVLFPLNDIASNYIHPILKKTVTQLLNCCVDNLKVLPYSKT